MPELNASATATPPFDGTKPILASRTVIVGALTALFGVLGFLHFLPTGLEAAPLADAVITILGAAAAFFRIIATKKLGA
jgi:uncharacterized membrane protein